MPTKSRTGKANIASDEDASRPEIDKEEGGKKREESEAVRVQYIHVDRVWTGNRARKDLGDVKSLAKNILEVGLFHPIVVAERRNEKTNTDWDLIAGARRLEAYKFLKKKEILANIIDIESIARGEFSENVYRKNLTPAESIAVMRKVQETRLRHRPGIEESSAEKGGNRSPFPKGKTRDVASSFTNLSSSSIGKLKAICDAAEEDPETYGQFLLKLDKDEEIQGVYDEFTTKQLEKMLGAPPPGPFSVIYVNPVWEPSPKKSRKILRAGPHSKLSLNQASKLRLPAAENAVMFMRTSDESLVSSLKLVGSYGFQFREDLEIIIEDETDKFFATREHEHLLIASRGNAPNIRKSSKPPASSTNKKFETDEYIHKLIEKISPRQSTFLEVFGTAKQREGWKQWLAG